MANVWTPKKVFDTNEVPDIRNYCPLKEWARGELTKLLVDGLLVGALFYGSTVQGDFYAGSDQDLFIFYRGEKFSDWLTAKKKFGELETEGLKRYNIGISPYPRISDSATDWRGGAISHDFNNPVTNNAMNSTSHRFVAYLKTCAANPQLVAENVVGVNPIDLLSGSESKISRYRQSPAKYIMDAEILSRMLFSQNRLKEKGSEKPESDGVNYNLLALRLREPVFTALDLLIQDSGSIPSQPDGRLLTKEQLVDAYIDRFGRTNSDELVTSIRAFTDYCNIINELSMMPRNGERRNHRSDYESLISRIYEETKGSDRFIDRCTSMSEERLRRTT